MASLPPATPELSPEQRSAVSRAGSSAAIKLVDPETKVVYVLVRADVYERFRSLIDGDVELSDAYPLMDAAVRAADWDDPAEDLYNDLDPRHPA